MELNNQCIPQQLTPPSKIIATWNDPMIKSPCIGCDFEGFDKNLCKTINTSCPLITYKEPISSAKSKEDYDCDNSECSFTGCCESGSMSAVGVYCGEHYKVVYNRSVKLNWPEERWHEPIQKRLIPKQCGFPGCEKIQTTKYCKYHQNVVTNRRNKLKWPEHRWHEPVRVPCKK